MNLADNKSAQGAVFTASVEEVPCMCEWIVAAAREAGMDDAHLWKLETSVDEAVTNIACYGYQGHGQGNIWLHWEIQNGFFVVNIQDTGIPFDQTQPTSPDFSKNICQRSIGGLGRHIMRNFMDDLSYQRIGERNSLTLIKSLHAAKTAAM